MSNLADLQKKALVIRDRYSNLNAQNDRQAWRGKEFMMGFVGDFGDLMKLVMAKENLRDIQDADTKLAHELADCLWSLLILADAYEVNLEAAFVKTMDELEQRTT